MVAHVPREYVGDRPENMYGGGSGMSREYDPNGPRRA